MKLIVSEREREDCEVTAFAHFDREEGWSREEVEEQVLTPLAKRSIMGTKESDPPSIMCYQLPGSIMKDRKPIPGGPDINPNDFAFARSLYPKPERRTVRGFSKYHATGRAQ